MFEDWLNRALTGLGATPCLPVAPVLRPKMHTFYGGAHLFKPETLQRMADVGERGLQHFWPTPEALGQWLAQVFHGADAQPAQEGDVRPRLAPLSAQALAELYDCLRARLAGLFIEDYRIDFEDGYGVHAQATELLEAERSARVLAEVIQAQKSAPQALPDMGIRLKPFSGAHREHSVRLLGRFFEVLQAECDLSQLPRFWVTLPKIRAAAEAVHFQQMVTELEQVLGLAPQTLGVELMFETLEAVRALGQADFLERWLPELTGGVCVRPTALVLGTYDTCAEWGIAAANQGHQHPVMDHVRLQALSWGNQIGAYVVDSITRAVPQLSGEVTPLVQHGQNVAHSLAMGVRAGWDIHPLQVLARHAVRLASVRQGLDEALIRLKQFLNAHTHASRVGAGFDDLATVRGLVSQVTLALDLGLITQAQIESQGIAWPPSLV